MVRLLIALLLASGLYAQQDGKLQIHFMDVGQGDGAVVISPKGQVVLFDAGEDMKVKSCAKPLGYLRQLGITKIDYLIVSHYHFDHIGCVPEVLAQFPLSGTAYDRGANYPSDTYTKYTQAVQGHRQTAEAGQTLKLDEGSDSEIDLKVVAVNGAGITTTNENDLSVSVLLTFGPFKAEIGGDLSGTNTATYNDIETTVAPSVGRLDVYKVHHHCSSYSSNETWLTATMPAVGIISTGDGNDYQHPAADCVARLHSHNLAAYWTETGAGATPQPGLDTVAGSVVVEVAPNATVYTVKAGSESPVTYPIAGPSPVIITPPPIVTDGLKYAWSKNATVYHYANCALVTRINASSLIEGDKPPEGKKLHPNCPQRPAQR